MAGKAGGNDRDGKGGPTTSSGSTREGTAAAAEASGVRPLRAALPLFLLSFPLPSPASAFSSQTHRSSPMNPPRCSLGVAPLFPRRVYSSPTPPPHAESTRTDTGSPWQAGEVVPTPAPVSPDLRPERPCPGPAAPPADTARGWSQDRGIQVSELGQKPRWQLPWGSRASLGAARRSSTAGSGRCWPRAVSGEVRRRRGRRYARS